MQTIEAPRMALIAVVDPSWIVPIKIMATTQNNKEFTGSFVFSLTRAINLEKGTPPSLANDHQTRLMVVRVHAVATARVVINTRIPVIVRGNESRASSRTWATGCPPIGVSRLLGLTLQNM